MRETALKKNSRSNSGDETQQALDCAMRLLARRDHSVAELERKLRAKILPDAVIAQIIGRLTKSGYIDDRRFAERWAESAVRDGRAYGPRLRLELTRRGISREIIAEVVAGIAASHGEEATLAEFVARKFPGFNHQSASQRDRRRVTDYLQRRGFSFTAILQTLRATDCCQTDP